ncbi:MAG TPA: phosphoribosylanthranilate isomerase [Candidatus Alectryocaccobium stercorigallinarum]|nr:phosphoribosylanthranilate isomerase [Candidatus Alectryocaccobium stercorigallinarum]
MTKIKICGVYREEDTGYINKYRPDYFGMVIDFERSHRNVSEKTAARLRGMVEKAVLAVGVFVNDDTDKIERLLKSGVIDIAQLHGDEDEEQIIRLKEKTGKPVWKAFKIRNYSDIETAVRSPADLMLLDNGFGTGERFDWNIIGEIDRPFALAGGICLENMEEAVNKIRPYLIDISSGVESDRKKDPDKIKAAVKLTHSLGGKERNV